MKRIILRVAIAFCTFIIGISAAAAFWVINFKQSIPDIPPISITKVESLVLPVPKATPDSTVYFVNFCELVRDSKQYDGKIIRTQASHLQGIDSSALTDSKCQGWIRPSCNIKDAPCEKIWSQTDFGETKVEVIGRYNVNVADLNPGQNGHRVNLLEILELKKVKSVKIRRSRG